MQPIVWGLWDAVVMNLWGWGELSSSRVAGISLVSISCGELPLCCVACVWMGAGGHLAPPVCGLQTLLFVACLCEPR